MHSTGGWGSSGLWDYLEQMDEVDLFFFTRSKDLHGHDTDDCLCEAHWENGEYKVVDGGMYYPDDVRRWFVEDGEVICLVNW